MRRPELKLRDCQGFTLIEVMTAVALLVVAATGVMSMHTATTKTNQLAHETTIAIDFAQTWMERLKRDSLLWTNIGEAARQAVPGPRYLSMPLSTPGADFWNQPVATPTESPAADPFGFDIDPANATYCMHFRNVVQHVALNPGSGLLDTDTLRVDVRVWWQRKNFAYTMTCPATPADVANRTDARVVFLSNVLRWVVP